VAQWREFGKVLEALLASVPSDADIQAVGFDEGRQPPRVDLWTATPGAIIGRRGATADAIRLAISQRLGREAQLNIREQSPGEPPR
jgi:small subunit ribosomal protein S3